MYSTSTTNITWAMTNVTYNNGGTQTTSISTSKKYYFHYLLRRNSPDNSMPASLEASNVIEYGTIPFYYLTAADGANLIGTYNATQTDSDWTGSGTHDDLVKIGVQDCNEGNYLTLTYFRKRSYDMSDGSGKYATNAVVG